MSRAGIKQIVLCGPGTLSGTPANPVPIGLRGTGTMEITPFKTVKDYRGRELPNMDDVKIEAESFQPSLRMLKQLIEFTNHNCDAQVTSVKQNLSAGEVYRFEGENSPGIDFELIYSADKRSIKVTLERAYPAGVLASILSESALLGAAIIPGLLNEEGKDFSRYRMPYTISIESPAETLICADTDFDSRKISIKSKGKKSAFNSSFVDYLTVSIELSTRNSSIASLLEQRNKGISPFIKWKESNGGNYYDAFEIAAGVLAQKTELKNSDDERLIKIVYEADIPIYDILFEFGAGKGGDETDTEGIKGGTVKIG